MAKEEDVEYVYEKPKETKKSHKELIEILVLIVIIIALSGYFIYTVYFLNTDINGKVEYEYLDNETYIVENETYITNYYTYTIDNQAYAIPSEYEGAEAVNYVKENYSSSFSEAKDFCINQFNGEWIDDSEKIGCFDMEGFFILFCSTENVLNILNFCYLIGGMPICSSTEVSCRL